MLSGICLDYPLLQSFDTMEDVERAIANFELQTSSKFYVYMKDKSFGAKGT